MPTYPSCTHDLGIYYAIKLFLLVNKLWPNKLKICPMLSHA